MQLYHLLQLYLQVAILSEVKVYKPLHWMMILSDPGLWYFNDFVSLLSNIKNVLFSYSHGVKKTTKFT